MLLSRFLLPRNRTLRIDIRRLDRASSSRTPARPPPESCFCTGSGIATAPGWDTSVRPSNLTARGPLRRAFAGGRGGLGAPVVQLAVVRAEPKLALAMRLLA